MSKFDSAVNIRKIQRISRACGSAISAKEQRNTTNHKREIQQILRACGSAVSAKEQRNTTSNQISRIS